MNFQDYTKTLSIIKLFDEELNKLKKIRISYSVASLDTHENKIYCLTKTSTNKLISHLLIYDNNLVRLIDMELSNDPNKPFYLPSYSTIQK